MIFQTQPDEPWGRFDFLLLEAYQILQDETCPKCGHPVWLCRSTSNKIEFKAQEGYCASERALMEYEDSRKPSKDRQKDKYEKASWGRFFYTKPVLAYGAEGDLPSRTEYYEELASTVE